MGKRLYNVFFHTHTISGIVISFALYIIFFAGAFSLFKEEISIWQDGNSVSHIYRHDIDYDRIFRNLDQEFELTGRDVQLNFGGHSDKILVYITPSQDSLASDKAKKSEYFLVDINSSDIKSYEETYSLGEFLYRLHFFAQIPYIGVYIAGFVSLFFLFAITTGVIIHWKKIIPNFYSFNPRITLKRVWADAHTALGVIGLPFQFVFAVTGAYFCLSLLVLLPAYVLFDGDNQKLMETLSPERKTYDWLAPSELEIPSFNHFAKITYESWENFELTRGFIRNYGGINMKYVITGEVDSEEKFIGTGRMIFDAFSGKIESVRNPDDGAYIEDVQRVLGRLHFADFGGLGMKIIYFILSILTCFVIITGVLIYVEVRNNKSRTLKQRLFTAKVGHIFIAICLSMLPVTALSFIFVKLTDSYVIDRQTAIYSFYFILWLIVVLFLRFKRDNYYTNKISLLYGSIFGFLIPLVNGFVSGNWIWKTYHQGQFEILLVDVLWLIIAIVSLLFYFKLDPKVKEKSSFAKFPIDYKNINSEIESHAVDRKEHHHNEIKQEDKNYIDMRTKIVILWIFLGIGWIVHHVYGLFNIYYNETLMIEGATGEAPLIHHVFRIIFEGFCLLFALLSLEISKQWFKWVSLIWAIIAGLYNVFHVVEALMYESSNISEIFILILVAIASILLVKNLFLWKAIE